MENKLTLLGKTFYKDGRVEINGKTYKLKQNDIKGIIDTRPCPTVQKYFDALRLRSKGSILGQDGKQAD